MNPHVERARLLLQQGNVNRAEESVRQALEIEPQSAEAMAILALCLQQQDKRKPALEAAQEAVGLDPHDAYAQYILAVITHDQGKLKESEQAVRQLLEINPNLPAAYGLLASIKLRLHKYADAEQAAATGLQLDAEDTMCRNMYAQALRIQGRKHDAERFISDTLRRTPGDSGAHVEMGWAKLHQGDHRAAMESFREALRLDPQDDRARQGMLQAIKAANPIYRVFLAYLFWIQSLSSKAQWAFIIGLWLGAKALGGIFRSQPHLAPYAGAVGAVYVLFVFSTWIVGPLFNVMLLVHPLGRHALPPFERNVTVGLAASMVLGIGLCLASIKLLGLLGLGLLFLALALPLGALGRAERPMNRWIIGGEVAIFVIGGLLCPILAILGVIDPSLFFNGPLFLALGCLLSTWVNSVLLSRER
ncbi:MAG: tetratricopeptide repeat protein [Verrucomicrobiota bacterium JB022]|nr:tetratricopeptide repeat protein [Verrucomicrobiota bacterium JB022]